MSKPKSVIICGNGPSLGQIDYRRFDVNAEVWRVNKFFLEDKYYVGKRVDAMFNGGSLADTYTRYFNLVNLEKLKIYEVNWERIFTDKKPYEYQLDADRQDFFLWSPKLRRSIQEIMKMSDEQNLPFSKFLGFNVQFFHKFPFTGVCAILYAALDGYKNIFYQV
jgi:alpha-2,3 sialyltransferase